LLDFRPAITEDFLFVYLGIISGIAVAVWTVFLQTDVPQKHLLFFVAILMISSAILALVATLIGPADTATLVDVSIAFLLAGLVWILVHTFLAGKRYLRVSDLPLSKRTVRSRK
jgi:hypothetical protein